ncbi:hypothetical protein G9444_0431 [Rhodococcus erythropolis]|uniref:Uncharacterized protein n=1 Tax=Rhodococcus erythropolis TaxID=1833 RepID=A0A6G9CKX9_RHOER|nr:hypothetical protein G9444_0431 [Rhodococcus erythropolis]
MSVNRAGKVRTTTLPSAPPRKVTASSSLAPIARETDICPVAFRIASAAAHSLVPARSSDSPPAINSSSSGIRAEPRSAFHCTTVRERIGSMSHP